MTVFFDVETQNSFQEVGGHYPERLRISVVVTYNRADLLREALTALAERVLARPAVKRVMAAEGITLG
mgnify:CR=1 FL=1